MITVAWFSYFPIEWLPDLPDHLQSLPRQHPATWQRVLLAELEKNPEVRLHVIVLRKHFPKSETFERNGVTFHLVKTVGGLRAPSLFWLDTLLIGRVLRQVRPDVVHAWGTENGAALVASRLGYPSVITMQGLLNWLAELTPLNTYHKLAARLEGLSLRRAKVVTAESSFAIRYLKTRYPHLELHQVEHAPLPLFSSITRRPVTMPLRFVYVGAVEPAKGADVMFKALAKIGSEFPWELIVVGAVDPERVKCLQQEMPAELRKNVRWRGLRTSQQIAEELETVTLMIYPTLCDNSPNAVKEAVVAGVPVVASEVGGIVDYVWPNRNGLLFRAGNVDDCVRVLREARAHPSFSRGHVELAALNEVRHYLSADSMTRRFCNLYRMVAESAAGKLRRSCASIEPR